MWLGANVMLAYPVAEAETLLQTKLSGAQQSLSNCEEDLDFLREQITVRPSLRCIVESELTWRQTLEVAMARVYNWDVTMKRKEKAEDAGRGKDHEPSLPNG